MNSLPEASPVFERCYRISPVQKTEDPLVKKTISYNSIEPISPTGLILATTVNTFCQYLSSNPNSVPQIWYPKVRENGLEGVLMKSFDLYVFAKPPMEGSITIKLEEPNVTQMPRSPQLEFNVGIYTDQGQLVYRMNLKASMGNHFLQEKSLLKLKTHRKRPNPAQPL